MGIHISTAGFLHSVSRFPHPSCVSNISQVSQNITIKTYKNLFN